MLGCILRKNNNEISILAYGEYDKLVLLFDTFGQIAPELKIKLIDINNEQLEIIRTKPECVGELFSNQFEF